MDDADQELYAGRRLLLRQEPTLGRAAQSAAAAGLVQDGGATLRQDHHRRRRSLVVPSFSAYPCPSTTATSTPRQGELTADATANLFHIWSRFPYRISRSAINGPLTNQGRYIEAKPKHLTGYKLLLLTDV